MGNNKDIYSFHSGKKGVAILIDPDSYNEASLKKVVEKSNIAKIDFFLVGGSLIFSSIEDSIKIIRRYCNSRNNNSFNLFKLNTL